MRRGSAKTLWPIYSVNGEAHIGMRREWWADQRRNHSHHRKTVDGIQKIHWTVAHKIEKLGFQATNWPVFGTVSPSPGLQFLFHSNWRRIIMRRCWWHLNFYAQCYLEFIFCPLKLLLICIWAICPRCHQFLAMVCLPKAFFPILPGFVSTPTMPCSNKRAT